MNNTNANIKGILVQDNDLVWQDLLNNPNIQELFDGIEQAEKDIQSGKKGQDFDVFFNNFKKEHFNRTLF